MRVTEQLAVAPLPESVQAPLNNSLPELLRLMAPLGASGVHAPSSSVTATATVAPWLTTTVEGVRVSVFNDTAATEIYALSLHDALPILVALKSAPTR